MSFIVNIAHWLCLENVFKKGRIVELKFTRLGASENAADVVYVENVYSRPCLFKSNVL